MSRLSSLRQLTARRRAAHSLTAELATYRTAAERAEIAEIFRRSGAEVPILPRGGVAG